MQSKNKAAPNAEEGRYLAVVAQLPCSVCDTPGPCHVHEIEQGKWWLSVALCPDCHTGAHNGWHGRRAIWKVKKLDILDALAITFRRVWQQITASRQPTMPATTKERHHGHEEVRPAREEARSGQEDPQQARPQGRLLTRVAP
ncbi:hypothetical protein UFOVP703_75 [uncultured Caudovirales phage]|uniref:Recombination endonuclease VII n=1 Tax=uncultured Caudovirales phage TaxID=2100421 RepID=A0A6J5NNF2_9CAUD|nr:hypothetical protein UFOVP703_75 [uncultured Caudovirales phage]